MGMMEDVLMNAKAAVDAVGEKAGRVIDKSKLRLALVDIRSELSKKYRMLGKVCYVVYTTGKNCDKSVSELVESIKELNAQLNSVREMLANAEKKTKCPACGAYNAKGALFCRKCGARLAAKAQADEEYTQEELLDFAEEIINEETDD